MNKFTNVKNGITEAKKPDQAKRYFLTNNRLSLWRSQRTGVPNVTSSSPKWKKFAYVSVDAPTTRPLRLLVKKLLFLIFHIGQYKIISTDTMPWTMRSFLPLQWSTHTHVGRYRGLENGSFTSIWPFIWYPHLFPLFVSKHNLFILNSSRFDQTINVQPNRTNFISTHLTCNSFKSLEFNVAICLHLMNIWPNKLYLIQFDLNHFNSIQLWSIQFTFIRSNSLMFNKPRLFVGTPLKSLKSLRSKARGFEGYTKQTLNSIK